MFYSDASLSKCSLLLFSFSRSSSQEFQNNPPELLTINLVPCVSVGTIKFVLLLTFHLYCVCRSFFMTSKSFLRTSSKHNLFDLSCFPFFSFRNLNLSFPGTTRFHHFFFPGSPWTQNQHHVSSLLFCFSKEISSWKPPLK